jgi:hypothetical protein
MIKIAPKPVFVRLGRLIAFNKLSLFLKNLLQPLTQRKTSIFGQPQISFSIVVIQLKLIARFGGQKSAIQPESTESFHSCLMWWEQGWAPKVPMPAAIRHTR